MNKNHGVKNPVKEQFCIPNIYAPPVFGNRIDSRYLSSYFELPYPPLRWLVVLRLSFHPTGRMKGLVFNIQRFSVSDGPGIRTTVFLKGCPLHCKWCHNPESISPDEQLVLRADRCVRCGDCFALCKNHAVRRVNGGFTTIRDLCVECSECIEVCNAEAREIAGKEMSKNEVMKEVEKDVIFYEQSGGGVSFSGGEPLLQH
jgi:pyruvate-formate lyase-activating enzyme